MKNRNINQLEKSSSVNLDDTEDLKKLLGIGKLSELLKQFYHATGLGSAIVDLEGNILQAVGWSRICTEFHRKNKISAERCLKSDTVLANQLKENEKYAIYFCENGMVDVATPIIIDGVHIANLFIGQFFFEKPDKDYFIKQAEELGFEKEKYMNALEECSVYSKETIEGILDFLCGFTSMIVESTLSTIKQKKLVAELITAQEQAVERNSDKIARGKYNRSLLEASLDPLITLGPGGILTDVNSAMEKFTGVPSEKLLGTDYSEYFTEPEKARAGYEEAFKEGKVVDYALEFKHIDGHTIPVLFNASLYEDDEGKTIGVFAAARDITAIQKSENELIYLKNNLELLAERRAAELVVAKQEIVFQNEEKEKRAAELIIADKELAFQSGEKADRAAELVIADKELAFQSGEKADRAAELLIANKELLFQNQEKEKRAAELLIANKELHFQNEEKEKRAAELLIANKELHFQNEEKEKRAAELLIANKELIFQNEEKEKRAAELLIANKELIFQNEEKEKRAAELLIANKELIFQNEEKEKRAAELVIADKELAFQSGEKEDRAAELVIADKELAFQSGQKADRAAELLIANKELRYQSKEKENRAAELLIANKELVFQNEEKEKRATELLLANQELATREAEIKELNSQLEYRVKERTAQLEAVNNELEALTYSISHDLKAPLRHITGYVSLLAKKYLELLPDEGHHYMDNISFAAKNMGELIDGLLQFSRTGRIDMKQKSINMNEIVEILILPIKEQDAEHRIELKIDPLPSGYGDLNMIMAVWSNLIENAVKFTKKKELARIWIGSEEKENDVIYFIKDNGAGFDMNYASKLFTVFQRLHSREDYEGTGIGLATVQRIITKHGGKIWAESSVGEGSTFYFSLTKRKESEAV